MKRPASSPASFSMTGWRPAHDAHLAGLGERRARVAVFGGDLGERAGDVEFGDGGGGGADPAGVGGGGLADFGEDLLFEFEDLLFGGEDLALVFLQFGSGEALGVDQRLFALVIGGSEMQVGFRDLDVVAEDVVEADLQRLRYRCGRARELRSARCTGGRSG